MPWVSSQGVYFLEITNTVNGCSNTGSLIVTQDFSTPPAAATSLGNLNCQTLSTQLSAAGSAVEGVNYTWTTTSGGHISNPTAPLTTVDAPGWYLLTVLSLDNGCTATDSTQVISTSDPIQAAWVSLDLPNCRNPEGQINIDSIEGGTAPFTYALDSGIFTAYPRFSYLDPGIYQVTIRDRDGCEWTGNFTLTAPGDILLELGEDQVIAQGESATITGLTNLPPAALDTVFWKNLPDGIPCPGCLSQTLIPLETTTYHLTLVDTNGCVASDKVTVFVTEQRPFYAPTAFSPNGDGINDRFLIFGGLEITSIRTLQIYDRWGNRVFVAADFAPNDPAAGWDGNFEGQAMKPGVFAWKAELIFADGSTGVFYGDLTLVR
jgi:gliding motility-associated-like protein